jgi:FkbM family methyltransferase
MVKSIEWFGTKFNISSSNQGIYGINFWFQDYENSQAQFFMRYIKTFPESTFIDLGAGIGAYTLPALAESQKVLAFEPEISAFQELQKNIQSNKFDQEFQTLNAAVVSGNDSNRKFGGDAKNQRVHNFSKSEVDFIEVIEKNRSAIIKIDIEGAEWPLFQNSEIIRSLRSAEFTLILAPHIGFHSDKRGLSYRHLMGFRVGVVRELLTLFKIALKFSFVFELDKGNFHIFSVFRKHLFSAKGWPNPLIISNNKSQIKEIKKMLGIL